MGEVNKRKRGNTAEPRRKLGGSKKELDEPAAPKLGGRIDGSTEGYTLEDLSCTICLELLDEPVASEFGLLRNAYYFSPVAVF